MASHLDQLYSVDTLVLNPYPYIVILSCLFYLFIFYVISPHISTLLLPQYTKQFTQADKINWDTRTSSFINAVVITALALYALATDYEALSSDPLWYDSAWVRTGISLLVGYTLADSLLMFIYWREIGEVAFIFHHGCCLFAYHYVILIPVFCYFSNIHLLAEFSTPFINLRWYLDILNRKNSRLFMINGVFMAIAFFLCRIMVIPVFYSMVWRWYGTAEWNTTGVVQYANLIPTVTLNLVNIFWMYKIIRGALKVLGLTDKKHSKQKRT